MQYWNDENGIEHCYIEFESRFSEEDLKILLDLGEKYKYSPVSDNETEEYFLKLLEETADMDRNGKKIFLEERVKRDFTVLEKMPDWIQEPEWQFHNGKPMCFIGQIEKTYGKLDMLCTAVFYVFFDVSTGETKTVVQYD